MCVERVTPAARTLQLPTVAYRLACVLVIASGICPTAGAAEGWRSSRQNTAQTGVADDPLPEELTLLWEQSLGDQILATVAIRDGQAYVPCLSGELACLSLKDGQRLWGYKTVENPEPNSFAPGFKSSPHVTADSVYLGDEDGVFHAIDRNTGKARWTFKTDGEIFSSAAVVDGVVLFGSYDNHLYALNIADGSLKWKFRTEGYVHCAPAIADGATFIAGCDEHLRVIDVATGEQRADFPMGSYLIASPAVVGSLLYVGTYGNEVLGVKWTTPEVLWRYKPGRGDFPFHSSAAVNNDTVVVGGRDKLVHAIDRERGTKRWTFATRGRIDSSPAIAGNRVFIGSNDGNLYSLSLVDGKELWRFPAGKPISAGPAIGDGVLVIGSEARDGKVYCFGAKP